LNYPQLTLSVWARAEFHEDGTYAVIGQDDTPWDRALMLDTRGGGFGWSAFAGSGPKVIGFQPLIVGEWVMLTGVYNQSAQTLSFYVNGNLIAHNTEANLTNGTSSLFLGKHAVTNAEYFNGIVDDVLIYNKALSSVEVQQLYLRTRLD
jgi:hypothetical protein